MKMVTNSWAKAVAKPLINNIDFFMPTFEYFQHAAMNRNIYKSFFMFGKGATSDITKSNFLCVIV